MFDTLKSIVVSRKLVLSVSVPSWIGVNAPPSAERSSTKPMSCGSRPSSRQDTSALSSSAHSDHAAIEALGRADEGGDRLGHQWLR